MKQILEKYQGKIKDCDERIRINKEMLLFKDCDKVLLRVAIRTATDERRIYRQVVKDIEAQMGSTDRKYYRISFHAMGRFCETELSSDGYLNRRKMIDFIMENNPTLGNIIIISKEEMTKEEYEAYTDNKE